MDSDYYSDLLARHQSLPILNVRGTHHEIGFNIGRTFSSFIHTYLDRCPSLNYHYIPHYNTKKGKNIYDETLAAVSNCYPQYLRELEGIAQGANVPFFKLFLLHINEIIIHGGTASEGVGCSTVLVNHGSYKLLGHSVDGLKEALGLCYLVSAHITESVPHEIFTSFCYPGLLPGYTMSFNPYIAFSMNIISIRKPISGRIPRTFVTRALLATDSFERAEQVIRCHKYGIADGMSLSLMTLKHEIEDSHLYNIEAGPNHYGNESILSTKRIERGEYLFHTNRYLRLHISEVEGPLMESCNSRQETQKRLIEPTDLHTVLSLIGDESSPRTNIFRNRYSENICTIAVGIFNRVEKTWSVYTDNPKHTHPLIILPLKSVPHT